MPISTYLFQGITIAANNYQPTYLPVMLCLSPVTKECTYIRGWDKVVAFGIHWQCLAVCSIRTGLEGICFFVKSLSASEKME